VTVLMVDCADRLGTAQVLRRLCPEPARLHDATRLCAPWSCWTGSAWPRQPLRGVKTNTLEIYEKGRRDCQQKRGLGARSYINAITEFERDHVHASHGAAKRLHPAKIAYGGAEGRDEERDAWEASIAAGVTLFDTAAMYAGGASERRLGEFSSDEALIATKFPATLWASADDMPGQLADSLARLRRDHVDVYQHHFPSRRVDIPRLMNHMADAVAAGQVRAVGVSNYSADQMCQAQAALAQRGIPLASNQVEYSLLHRRPETNGVLDACRELGVTLIAYQPLAGGARTGRYTPTNRPSGLRRLVKPFRGRGLAALEPINALLREIGERYGKNPRASGPALAHRERHGPTHPGSQESQAGHAECRGADVPPDPRRDRSPRCGDARLAPNARRLGVLDRIDEIVTPGTLINPRRLQPHQPRTEPSARRRE
jgi:aryl-alcohol dehydrogenase-like predicted oxidoreductase